MRANGISVLISTWNNLKYLKTTIQSLRDARTLRTEICVCADGCTDGTVEWLEEQEDVLWTLNKRHIGSITGRVKASELATQKYLFLSEDGLFYHPKWDVNFVNLYEKFGPEALITIQVIQQKSHGKFGNPALSDNIEGFNKEEYFKFVKSISSPDPIPNVSWGLPLVEREIYEEVGREDTNFDPISFSILDLKLRLKQHMPNLKFYRAQDVLPFHFVSKSWIRFKGEPRWEEGQKKCVQYFDSKWGFRPADFPQLYKNMNIQGWVPRNFI